MSAVMDTATCADDFGSLPATLAAWDAPGIEAQLNCDGYALLPGLFLPHADALSRMAEATTALQAVSLSPTQGQALPPLLAAWREAPCYTPRERAARAWAEAVTLLKDQEVGDAQYHAAREHFDDKALVDLTLAIVAINGWNRLSIAFRTPAGSYQPTAHS